MELAFDFNSVDSERGVRAVVELAHWDIATRRGSMGVGQVAERT